jgi:hypothetical protein
MYSHDDHCNLNHLWRNGSLWFILFSFTSVLAYVFFLHIAAIIFRYLMVQVTFGRWCAPILASSPLTFSSLLPAMLGHHTTLTIDVLKPSFGRAGASHHASRGTAPTSQPPPPPPMSIEQVLVIQNELMRSLMENMGHWGWRQTHHHPMLDSSYWLLGDTLQCSLRNLIRWRWITGFASLSPSLDSCTTQSIRRLCMQPSSFVGPPAPGGWTISPLSETATS